MPHDETCFCVYCMGPDNDKDEPPPWLRIAALNTLVVVVLLASHWPVAS